MSKVDHTKPDRSDRPQTFVKVSTEVVELVEELVSIRAFGDLTIGGHIDHVIDMLLSEGKSLGRITIDLTEYCKVFGSSDQIN